ncbi:MAG: DUF4294 domain-containing protein [Paludibacter sp.]|nr:DUF4294 domain-containing protein [Paludibacter sp.]
MNFFNKYKSKIISVIVSILFYGTLLLLLFFTPRGDSSLRNNFNIKNREEEVKFQMMEDVKLPPTLQEQKTADKILKKESATESQPKEIDKSTPETKEIDKSPDESDDDTNVTENQDSVMLAELKKSLEVFKEIVPQDSLKKNPIQEKSTQAAQKVLAQRTFYSENDYQFIRDNYRTILSIRKIYPYVMKTKEIVTNLNAQLAKMTNNSEKRKLIKQTEKELFQNFEKDVRGMNYSQGKLMLKLIARETDQTAYGLIKTYKGGLPATFWYGVGLLFHEDLKIKYDSLGEDAILEQIIKKYKLGKL